ncbi:hypothetical protein TNCV_4587131 [Trichonephila clavipes]|nr:hypothetical protein TNCV_4587131 [Trichonephila clavipes]
MARKRADNREGSLGHHGFVKPVFTKDSKPLGKRKRSLVHLGIVTPVLTKEGEPPEEWRRRRLWFCVKGRPSNARLADRPLCCKRRRMVRVDTECYVTDSMCCATVRDVTERSVTAMRTICLTLT